MAPCSGFWLGVRSKTPPSIICVWKPWLPKVTWLVGEPDCAKSVGAASDDSVHVCMRCAHVCADQHLPRAGGGRVGLRSAGVGLRSRGCGWERLRGGSPHGGNSVVGMAKARGAGEGWRGAGRAPLVASVQVDDPDRGCAAGGAGSRLKAGCCWLRSAPGGRPTQRAEPWDPRARAAAPGARGGAGRAREGAGAPMCTS